MKLTRASVGLSIIFRRALLVRVCHALRNTGCHSRSPRISNSYRANSNIVNGFCVTFFTTCSVLLLSSASRSISVNFDVFHFLEGVTEVFEGILHFRLERWLVVFFPTRKLFFRVFDYVCGICGWIPSHIA